MSQLETYRDENTYQAYRHAIGIVPRPQGGTDVIAFPAGWMVNASKRVDRPEIELDDTRLVNSVELSGYTFCPIRLAKWAIAVLRRGQSVTGLYPRTYGNLAGRFLIKRTGNAVLGYCEIGTHHYVYRPSSIHRYDLPYHYQRPMADLSLAGFSAMYPDDKIWHVDASAKEVYLFGKTSAEAEPDWHLATLSMSRREPTLLLVENQVMPINPSLMRRMVLKDLEELTRLLTLMVFPKNLFGGRPWRPRQLLEDFDCPAPGERSWSLSYEQGLNITKKVQELMTFLEVENDRITSGAEDVVPWVESVLLNASRYIKQQFGHNYSSELKNK